MTLCILGNSGEYSKRVRPILFMCLKAVNHFNKPFLATHQLKVGNSVIRVWCQMVVHYYIVILAIRQEEGVIL